MIQTVEHPAGEDDLGQIHLTTRLEWIVTAARRGATVRSNRATVEYLNWIAARKGLDPNAATDSPTGGGIHMEVVLVQVDGKTGNTRAGLNGGEVSHKVNREIVLLVDPQRGCFNSGTPSPDKFHLSLLSRYGL